ncbi:MAG TPA: elongation factor Ts [Campylobacteraceae bacterium]|nr:elongation factor Ts [Campylobacteraceae bacterium]HHD83387.1 elongation factor Ts [Campylobacteraceae bacterium]
MAVTAAMVKELREKTGAGMMDCKKALVEANGDMEGAIDWLKKKGLASAGKKSDRVAAEGTVAIKLDDDLTKATIAEINAETDFVAKNDLFQEFAKNVVAHIHETQPADIEALNAGKIGDETFEEYVKSNIAKIGENLVVRRFETLEAGENEVVNGYIHMGGKIGVIVEAKYENPEQKEKVAEFLKQLAMHIAALKPQILSYKEFDKAFVEKETEGIAKSIEKENEELKRLGKPLKNVPQFISKLQLTDEVLKEVEEKLKEELKAEGKPEKIWDRILPGKMERFISDNTLLDQQMCLLDQFYALDDKKSVAQVIEEKSKELGGKIEITKFVRYELGEGIEKKDDDFASEVAAQLG